MFIRYGYIQCLKIMYGTSRHRYLICQDRLAIQNVQLECHFSNSRPQKPTNCLSVFDHFVGLVLKELRLTMKFGKQQSCFQSSKTYIHRFAS